MQNKKTKKFIGQKKALSVLQILILVVGLFSFSYILGELGKSKDFKINSKIGFVSAQPALCEDVGGVCKDSCGVGEFWDTTSLCGVGEYCCVLEDPNTFPPDPSLPTSPTSGEVPYTYNQGYGLQVGENAYAVPDSVDANKDKKIDEKEVAEAGGKGFGGFAQILGAPSTVYSSIQGTQGIVKFFKNGFKLSNTGTPTELSPDLVETGEIQGGLQRKLIDKSVIKEAAMPYLSSFAGSLIGAFIAWGFYKWIVKADVRNMRDITHAAIVGTVLGTALGPTLAAATLLGPIGAGLVIALLVTFSISLFTFKKYAQEIFAYVVTAWKPAEGGQNCGLCNELKYGCSEYQCKSFGRSCELENKGMENEVCVWKNPGDKFPPEITALEKVLPSPDYSYQPLQVIQGVKLDYSKDPSGKGCLPPYSSVTLGIETNEFADCKIDLQRTEKYEDMLSPMNKIEGFDKEHILELPHSATPSAQSQNDSGVPLTEITNGQAQEFYIRCQDVNGNSNTDEFLMEFCVQDGPDTSAPVILGTNFLQTSYLQYNQENASLEVYTNEPATCKWNFDDIEYDLMQFDMDKCSQAEGDYLFSGFKYGCLGTLKGLKNNDENKVYIRCKDKPWWEQGDEGQQYANENSYSLTLKGTQPLEMDTITVNGKPSGSTIKDNVNVIKAKIEAKAKFGADNGKSKCQYGTGNNFNLFYNDGNTDFVNINSQNLYLPPGTYNYDIKCFDAGGNTANGNLSFILEQDSTPPLAVRAYFDVNNLRIITNEPAECVYTTLSNVGCDYIFDDGSKMSKVGENSHYTSWIASKKYYIKCRDSFKNEPLPGQCSAVISTFSN